MSEKFYNDVAPEIMLYYFPLSIPLLAGLVMIFYGHHIRNYWVSGYGFFSGMTFASQFYHYQGDVNYFPIWMTASLLFVATHLLFLTIRNFRSHEKHIDGDETKGSRKGRAFIFFFSFLFTCFILVLFVNNIDIQM